METQADFFDYGWRSVFAYDAKIEHDPEARPMFFVCSVYEQMYLDADRERERATALIQAISKKRKVKTIRDAIKKAMPK